MKTIIGLTVTGIVLIFGLIYFGVSVTYNNSHKDYRTRFEAEQGNIETRIDNMWKIISDKFTMSQEYSTQFKEVAKVNIGAFTQGGEAWKWINTQLPQIDPSIFKEVMASIEAERLSFEQSQKKIIDVVREHNNLVLKFPGSWFIENTELLTWEVISSTETKEIMITKKDERTISTLKTDA